jgi:tape measure domain-containing protein
MGPAAILDIVVKANTTPATHALRRLNTEVSVTSKQMTAMDRIAGQQQRNLHALGSAFKVAAGGAAILAGAGLYNVVKSGVEFNKTMESNRFALKRFVGSAKETDKFLNRLFKTAKKTPFEFTDLTTASRRLMAFGLEADKTERILGAVGDAIAAMGGGAENIDRVTLALGQMQAKGKVSAEELLQLTEAGIPAYQILKKELGLTSDQVANIGNEGIKAGEAIDALTRGMEKQFGGAAAEQAKTFEGMTSTMKDNWAQMTGAMTEGLFTESKSWIPEINKTMTGITKIFQNDDLNFGERVTESWELADQRLGPLIDNLKRQLDEADIGKKLLDGLEWFLPRAAEAAARGSGNIAIAFVKGFLDAGIWGKVFLAGWFIKALGGLGLLKAQGATAGQTIGRTLGRGIIAGVVLGLATLLPDMVEYLSKQRFKIQQVGVDIGEWFVNGMIDAVNLGIRTINDVMDKANIAAFAGVDAPNIGEIGKVDFTGPVEAAEDARKQLREVAHGIQKDWQRGWMAMSDTAEDSSTSAWHYWRDSLGKIADRGVNQGGRFETALERAFEGVSGAANREGGDAFKHWRDWLDQTKSMGDSKTTAFKNSVSGNFRSLASASIGAIASLARETQETLRSLKVKSAEGIYVSTKAGGDDTVKAQKGAVIVPGSGSGDKVPALLEPGEVVINRKAAAALGGAQKVNRLNKMVPRFAGGGIVQQALGPYSIPPIAYDPNHAGGNSHLHLDFFTRSQAIGVGKKMQNMGWSIGEYSGNVPGFGPITTQHQSPGHYDGTAFDANTAADETRAQVAAIARLLGGKGGGAIGGAAAKRLGRVLLDGPAGPLLSGGQSAIDMVHSAANKFIGNKAPMEGAERGANVAVGAGAVSRPEMRKLLSAHGMPNWTGWIALAESGLDPNAHNASGASGLWQIMMPLHAGIVKGNVFDPNVNTAAAKVLWNQSGSTPWNPSKYAGAIPEGWGPHQGQAFRKGGIAKLAGGAVVGPGGGTGSGSAPWAKLLTRLKKLRGKTPFIEERIANAQILDALSTSPAGAELSSGELSGQIGLGQALLSNLTERAGGIGRVLKMLPKKDKRRKGLMGELTGLQGITGQGGSILQAKQALDALMGSSAAGGIDYEQIAALRGQLLQQANQRYAVSQAQYGVFNGSATSPADVRITFYEGSRDAQVSVNGTKQNVSTMIEQSLRRTGQRVLPGSGGY